MKKLLLSLSLITSCYAAESPLNPIESPVQPSKKSFQRNDLSINDLPLFELVAPKKDLPEIYSPEKFTPVEEDVPSSPEESKLLNNTNKKKKKS